MATDHARTTTTDKSAATRSDVVVTRWLTRVQPEHLSVLPVLIAVGAIAGGAQWAWPVAAMSLAVAYLFVFLLFRHDRS